MDWTANVQGLIGGATYPLLAMLLAMVAGWWMARRIPFGKST